MNKKFTRLTVLGEAQRARVSAAAAAAICPGDRPAYSCGRIRGTKLTLALGPTVGRLLAESSARA